jgi:hypothetical protein
MATAMDGFSDKRIRSEERRLGRLAMKFRSTSSPAERNQIQAVYGEVVNNLINSGRWTEVPPPEDLLPDKRMPDEFFKYWKSRSC